MKKLVCSLCFVVLFTMMASAAVTYIGPVGGNWNVGENWSLGAVPVSGDRAIVSIFDSGAGVGEPGIDPQVVINSAVPDIEILDVGQENDFSGYATLNINSGGSLAVSTTSTYYGIGKSANAKGRVNINNGGTLSMANYLVLGYAGYGELNLDGGTLNVGRDIRMGQQASHDGAYINMTGGTLNMNTYAGTQTLFMGYSADASLTKFDMSGGTINLNSNYSASNIVVGYTAGSNSEFNLSGGTINTPIFKVGYKGTGTMNLSGNGILNTSNGLQVGSTSAHGDSFINMSGGQINATNGTGTGYVALGWGADLAHESKLILTGGSIVTNHLAMASDGRGHLCIDGKGGSVTTNNLYVGGFPVPEIAGDQGDGYLEYKIGAQGVTAIVVSNSVTLVASDNIAALLVSLTAAPPLGNILLVDNRSSNLVSGVFDSVNGGSAAEGASVVLNYSGIDYNYKLTYVGVAGTDNIGNDIMLVIPEPATIALIAFGSLLFVRHRRN